MKTQLKFGLSQAGQYAPRWLVNTTSVITLLVAAKHYLVEGLPLLDEHAMQAVSAWVSYVLDLCQVLLALAVIFFGENTKPIIDDSSRN